MDDSAQEEYVSVSRYDRQRELAKRRLLFWSRRLQLMPHEVEKMSDGELNQRWQVFKREEDNFDNRQALFDRWKQLHDFPHSSHFSLIFLCLSMETSWPERVKDFVSLRFDSVWVAQK